MNIERQPAEIASDQLYSADAAGIAYIKRLVGDGETYANDVARAVFSDRGGYYELLRMPAEFSGALGETISRRTISRRDLLDLVKALRVTLADAAALDLGAYFSMFALDEGSEFGSRGGVFVYEHSPGEQTLRLGILRADPPPIFLKLRFLHSLGSPSAEILRMLALPAITAHVTVFALAPASTDDGHYVVGCMVRDPETIDLGARIQAAAQTRTLQ